MGLVNIVFTLNPLERKKMTDKFCVYCVAIDYLKLVIYVFIYFTKLNFKKIGPILYKYQQLFRSNSILDF